MRSEEGEGTNAKSRPPSQPPSPLTPPNPHRETFGDPDMAPTFIVGCKIGQRSLAGMGRLRDVGYNAVNLDGGIDTWAAMGLPIEYVEAEGGNADDLFL